MAPADIPRGDVRKVLEPIARDKARVNEAIEELAGLVATYRSQAAAERSLPARAERRKLLRALSTGIDRLDELLAATTFIDDQAGHRELRIAIDAALLWQAAFLEGAAAEPMRKGPDPDELRDWLIARVGAVYTELTGLGAAVRVDRADGTPGGPFYDLLWTLLTEASEQSLVGAIRRAMHK